MKKIISWKNKTVKKEHLQALKSSIDKEAISYSREHNYEVGVE